MVVKDESTKAGEVTVQRIGGLWKVPGVNDSSGRLDGPGGVRSKMR